LKIKVFGRVGAELCTCSNGNRMSGAREA
jgi:hypothetical protein